MEPGRLPSWLPASFHTLFTPRLVVSGVCVLVQVIAMPLPSAAEAGSVHCFVYPLIVVASMAVYSACLPSTTTGRSNQYAAESPASTLMSRLWSSIFV